ncbi:MAG: malonyl-ACP O-methyltransferase BioC [Candidatus Delongbacteria bacterium]|nr:malonyl-ACP O-methyltransferase BioC [Candidatus Delongbacteria bacterium]
MSQRIDKKLVRERFKKSMAHNNYCRNASVQDMMAEYLLQNLRTCTANRSFQNIFEQGSGTGILTKKLLSRYDPKSFTGNDIVDDSEEYIEKIINDKHPTCKFNFISGDIEELTDYPENVDLVISNATIQWLSDTKNYFDNLAANVIQGTFIAFTTFGTNNLLEINKITSTALNYHTIDTIREILSKKFEILLLKEDTIKLQFKTPIEVIRHLRSTGVTGINRTAWTKKILELFSYRYTELFGNDEGVPLSYHPIYIIAKRK